MFPARADFSTHPTTHNSRCGALTFSPSCCVVVARPSSRRRSLVRQVMRATAFIQRAYSHGRALTDLLQKVVVDMPTQTTLDVLHEVLLLCSSIQYIRSKATTPESRTLKGDRRNDLIPPFFLPTIENTPLHAQLIQ